MNNIDELKNYINNLEETKRYKELEKYIDNNEKIKLKIAELKEKQKQLVNAKEFNQLKQAKIYEDEYNKIKEELFNMPFVEEYVELVEIINEKLDLIANEIENKLDKIIND